MERVTSPPDRLLLSLNTLPHRPARRQGLRRRPRPQPQSRTRNESQSEVDQIERQLARRHRRNIAAGRGPRTAQEGSQTVPVGEGPSARTHRTECQRQGQTARRQHQHTHRSHEDLPGRPQRLPPRRQPVEQAREKHAVAVGYHRVADAAGHQRPVPAACRRPRHTDHQRDQPEAPPRLGLGPGGRGRHCVGSHTAHLHSHGPAVRHPRGPVHRGVRVGAQNHRRITPRERDQRHHGLYHGPHRRRCADQTGHRHPGRLEHGSPGRARPQPTVGVDEQTDEEQAHRNAHLKMTSPTGQPHEPQPGRDPLARVDPQGG